ncbi:hypothetical protein IJI94_02205 [Candidatus Saccharibacteria bacterium]|nr:hypothetical protein [Candidatus Saccharibacteria bacterium]
MQVKIVSFSYRKSIPGHCIQGIKGGKIPRNAVAGMNGTVVLSSTPPSVHAIVKNKFGCLSDIDLYPAIKAELSRLDLRVTEKKVEKICGYLKDNEILFNITVRGHKWYFEDIDIAQIVNDREE